MLLGASFVGIIGHLGLVLIKGQGTDKALPPGVVPALRGHTFANIPIGRTHLPRRGNDTG